MKLELRVIDDLQEAGAVREEEDDSRQQDAEGEEGEEFHWVLVGTSPPWSSRFIPSSLLTYLPARVHFTPTRPA